MKPRTADMAKGKWRGILLTLGVDQKHLTGKHGPCPMCGGTDRFRWDNQHGNGGYICGACGAGSGFKLLMEINGWDFATAASRVDEIVGNVACEPAKRGMDEAQRRRMLNELWAGASPLAPGDLATAYLGGRVPLPKSIPLCLRFTASCPSPDGFNRPALLALVTGADGKPVNIHRTFLGHNGKADMPNPRAMMPGSVPEGSAIRLGQIHGERLGIAEGIETALAASARFGLPVWSAINSATLAKWMPPPTVREVLIFGDCDAKFGGQAAAFSLAHRLAVKPGMTVQVHIPDRFGLDWADVA